MLRALRLVKLVRLMRASRIARRWEGYVGVNYATLSLACNGLGVLLLAHWMACVWGLSTTFGDKRDTWLGEHRYCVLVARNVSGVVTQEEVCVPPVEQYVAALYWSTMTITSIGYGDIAATPGNSAEQALAIVLMMLGSLVYGFVLASFCTSLAEMNPEAKFFRRQMDRLNRFMLAQGLPQPLRVRLREYFYQSAHLHAAQSLRQLLASMSPELQGEVAWACSSQWLLEPNTSV